MRFPIAIVLCCLAIGCHQRPSEHKSAPAFVAEVDRRAIAEAVWRYQMKHQGLDAGQHWYLQLQKADPPPEVMDLFEGPMAPASEFKPGDGVKLAVDAIELTPEGATVEGHWLANGRCGEGYRYTLRRAGEVWSVTDAVMFWIA